MHRHSREDELSIVLEGRIGALLGDEHVEAAAGSYVLKPRDQWHTFWNAGDTPLRFVELLVPAGFEDYFARLSPLLQAAGGADPGCDWRARRRVRDRVRLRVGTGRLRAVRAGVRRGVDGRDTRVRGR